ncbi:hypothetical protein AFCA_009543 [Aspergillus flavus]|uniref:AflYa/ nadA/ NADH oxidase n=1 Tax=Aspergillus flavus TaxID=5059 RepID=A0AB74C8M8_ASPFL|nr:aflYa/ nadA/ NADH oxidase [Aspergillus flavus]UDD62215.1 hypothetical protein AFCA_009543 [Aspergillus flavus]
MARAGQAVDPSPLGQPLEFHFARRSAPNRFLKAAMSERMCSWTEDNSFARGIPSTIQHCQPKPISVSDVPLDTKNMGNTFAVPRAATEDEIKNIITGFAHAAEFLDRAGYDGIELHAAHGYLLSQFLSQATNLRRDKYGGSPTNRMRLILEIRAAITEKFEPNGIVRDEAWELCRAREEHEFDFVELSGGKYKNLDEDDTAKHVISKKHEAFFLDVAQKVVSSLTKMKSYLTGGFRSTAGMVDGIGLARPFCQEPFLCHDILSGKIPGATIPVMDQLNYQLAVAAACIQMRQIGNNVQPMDLSSQDAVDAVTAAVKG